MEVWLGRLARRWYIAFCQCGLWTLGLTSAKNELLFLRAAAFAQGNAQDFGLWIRFVGLGWVVPAGIWGGWTGDIASAPTDVCASGQAGDLPFHGRRTKPRRFLRLQAGVDPQSRQRLQLHWRSVRHVWQEEQTEADEADRVIQTGPVLSLVWTG